MQEFGETKMKVVLKQYVISMIDFSEAMAHLGRKSEAISTLKKLRRLSGRRNGRIPSFMVVSFLL